MQVVHSSTRTRGEKRRREGARKALLLLMAPQHHQQQQHQHRQHQHRQQQQPQLVMAVVMVAIMALCSSSAVRFVYGSSRPMFFDEFVVEPAATSAQMKKDLAVVVPVVENSSSNKKGSGSNSGSILQALLESQYSEFIYYLEKASLLHKLENVVNIKGSVTIFAPKNSFLEQQLDADFRNFLLQDGNELVLQRVLQFHVLPMLLDGAGWSNRSVVSLSGDAVNLRSYGLKRYVDFSRVFSPNSIVRDDGIVHGVNGFLIPRGVSSQFEDWKTSGKLAILPQSAPEGGRGGKQHRYVKRGNPPSLPSKLSTAAATAPAPMLAAHFPPSAPASAPAPGPSQESFTWDETEEVAQFMTTLINFGGYNDMAELLVNYTSLATEIARLMKIKGYRLTILAPNDEAMAQLTPEHLNSRLERILYYHILSEYQTEESMYNAVRRRGKQTYSTLLHPLKLLARESDGTVLFGDGENSAHIYDHDIYVDGRLSIQGVSKVLIPPAYDAAAPTPDPSST